VSVSRGGDPSITNEVRVSRIATYVFATTAIGADFVPFLRGPAAVVAVTMFIAGAVAMVAAVLIAASRSGASRIGVAGLFFLSGTAPRDVQRQLLGGLVIQAVVGFGTAAVRPYTSSALGVLAPVAGLGLCGLWAARHGSFERASTLDP